MMDEGFTPVKISLGLQPGRQVASITIAVACTLLGMLGLFGRLNYIAPTTFDLLAMVANNKIWTIAFILVSVGVWSALISRRKQREAMQAVFIVTAPWAVYNLLWGLTTQYPVSLAAPILAGVMAGVAHALVLAWTPQNGSYSQDH